MKFSNKSKYGLSAMILLAVYEESNTLKSLISLSEELDISKIYLEQVFSQLKANDLVVSIKGPKGGYKLARKAKDISVYHILEATEKTLFEVEESGARNIDKVISSSICEPFQDKIHTFFSSISLVELKEQYEGLNFNDSFMYYL
ncbi:hypothetical protein A4S06_09980 [Erysipelotrichaceae bacterium MTC7]|nr:hypothetical protein A4S06_09980 [Erysipelotrichaceae bacterium MTC7]